MAQKLLLSLVAAASLALTAVVSAAPVRQGAVQAAPAAPTSIHVAADDRYATLTWDDYASYQPVPPTGVGGYRITWGPSGGTQTTQLAGYPTAQLQPLTPGVTYSASIQSIGYDGALSTPVSAGSFQSNPTRVNALRSSMTGFFDDFNQPEGAPDSLKWNVAYSACVNPQTSGFFVNAQFHAHTMTGTSTCDRGQTVVRPRATFDITNRTGTIAFDFDASEGRDHWYLDYVPSLMDITGQVNNGSPFQGNVAHDLRLDVQNNVASIQYAGDDGTLREIANSHDLREHGINLVPNVRLPWLVHVSQTHVSVSIAGTTVLDTAISLPFSTGTVLWDTFAYNSPKGDVPDSLQHWDNFGFDGPGSATVTRTYTDGYLANTDFAQVHAGTPVERDVPIPDSLAGVTAARLMVTQQTGSNQAYNYGVADYATLNGTTIPIPAPTGPAGAELIGAYVPYSSVIPIDPGLLKQGTNMLSFSLADSGVLNVHLEVDTPTGSAVAYTQPAAANGQMFAMNMPMVGPGATFSQVGTVQAWTFTGGAPDGQNHVQNVSGQVPLQYALEENSALQATGKLPGIVAAQIVVDGKPLADLIKSPQSPVPASYGTYTLDTTKLANGQHTIELAASDTNGTQALPDYFESYPTNGSHAPIYLNVQNAATASPSPSPSPTASPTPAMTPSPAPTPTRPPTASPSPVHSPSPTSVPSATPTSTPSPTPSPTQTLEQRVAALEAEVATLQAEIAAIQKTTAPPAARTAATWSTPTPTPRPSGGG